MLHNIMCNLYYILKYSSINMNKSKNIKVDDFKLNSKAHIGLIINGQS